MSKPTKIAEAKKVLDGIAERYADPIKGLVDMNFRNHNSAELMVAVRLIADSLDALPDWVWDDCPPSDFKYGEKHFQ